MRVMRHGFDASKAHWDDVRYSTLGSIIMRVAYGFDDAEANKALVTEAERLVSTFTEAVVPGRYLVNSFPSLGKIPDWFPGAGFKEKFRELDRMNEYMLSSPFKTAKENFVSTTHQHSLVIAE